MRIICIVLLLFTSACASGGYSYNPKPVSSREDFWGDVWNEVAMSDQQRRIVIDSKRYLGAPYVLGGEHPSEGGFDCSGFTQFIYAKEGIALPRTTKAQHRVGYPVSHRNLQPGDLVFFDLSGRLSHVGVYIGNGKFFHASSGAHKKLVIGDLRKRYFAQRYNSARRVLN